MRLKSFSTVLHTAAALGNLDWMTDGLDTHLVDGQSAAVLGALHVVERDRGVLPAAGGLLIAHRPPARIGLSPHPAGPTLPA